MLTLRRGTVVEAGDRAEPWQRLEVDVDGERRPAVGDVALVGACEVGDEVVVNVAARDLGLGSGGRDIVHVNLTRGLTGTGAPGAHVMKLNYTSLQHAVEPVEEAAEELPSEPLAAPVAIFSLHGHLPPLAWALDRARPGSRAGYVQTAGGALPGAMSRVVRELRDRELLAGHITAAPAYGGEEEAITVAGAIDHGVRRLGWEAVLVGPGPGILGSGSALGHGGMAALDSAHAALALGAPTVLVPRMSEADPRPRHRGLSHHTRTVLELLLEPVAVALPGDQAVDDAGPRLHRHNWCTAEPELEAYAASGLPTINMGREDPLFFAAALAAGSVLARMIA